MHPETPRPTPAGRKPSAAGRNAFAADDSAAGETPTEDSGSLASGITLAPWDARGDIVVFRLAGTQTLRDAVEQLRAVLELAAEEGCASLLVDARAYAGPSPDMAARHAYLRTWAAAAGGRVCVAMLVQARYIDPERFGVVVAGNFGLKANVFTDETQAVRWLREVAGG